MIGSKYVGIDAYVDHVENNIVAHCGEGGIRFAPAYEGSTLRGNTCYDNGGWGFQMQGGSNAVANNIGSRNRGFGFDGRDAPAATLSCNDWFENDSSAVIGVAPSPEDLAVDPRFCDVANDDVHLAANSPLLNAPGCGLIGALGEGCEATPTLLSLFTAERGAEGVRLRWHLADAGRFAEVWIERADASPGPWTKVATEQSIDGGMSVGLDRSASAEREYWYRLAAHDPGGAVVVISDPVRVEANLQRRFELTGVTPNPGSGPVRIGFALVREAAVEMAVFDLQGRHVTTLVHGSLAAGAHAVEWSGRSTTPGVYLLDYRYPGGHQIRRLVRLR